MTRDSLKSDFLGTALRLYETTDKYLHGTPTLADCQAILTARKDLFVAPTLVAGGASKDEVAYTSMKTTISVGNADEKWYLEGMMTTKEVKKHGCESRLESFRINVGTVTRRK